MRKKELNQNKSLPELQQTLSAPHCPLFMSPFWPEQVAPGFWQSVVKRFSTRHGNVSGVATKQPNSGEQQIVGPKHLPWAPGGPHCSH